MGTTTFTGPVISRNGFTGDLTGNVTGSVIGNSDAMSGAGAVSLSTGTTFLTTTGANALTLANGTPGQTKTITMVVDGGDGTLTPATKTGFATITFTAVGNSVTLAYAATIGWTILSNNGATVA